MAPINGVNGGAGGLIVSFGEMLIDFVPTVSGVSLAEAPGFLKAPGGAPANVAIAVTRLGGRSAFVGKLGDDEFGHMLAGILKENGVRCDGINFDVGARTALAFVTLRADGEREFMFYRNPSADMLLKPEELNLELIRSVRLRFLTLLLQVSFFGSFFLNFFFGARRFLEIFHGSLARASLNGEDSPRSFVNDRREDADPTRFNRIFVGTVLEMSTSALGPTPRYSL